MAFPEGITVEYLNMNLNKGLTKHLGLEYTELGPDYICGKIPVDDRTIQPMGLLHGGASVVLAESLGSIASNLLVDNRSEACVGLEINANHIRSATSGYVYGKAILLHKGKKTHVWSIEIRNEAKELVSVSRLTVAVISKRN